MSTARKLIVIAEETKAKISRAMTGRVISQEWRDKISQTLTGRKVPLEVQSKINEKLPRRENHPRWRGGIDRAYSGGWGAIRKKARERDGHKCLVCGYAFEWKNKDADVHHIDKNKYNNDPSNLISLCSKCHRKCDNNLSISIPMLHDILAERYGYTYG